MNSFPIIKQVPSLHGRVSPAKLIACETELHSLRKLRNGNTAVLIKREDQTDTVTYGGNKVRNLEFVLGEALALGYTEVSTLIAYGSNFTAALAAQSEKVGLRAKLSQFVMQRNEQVEAHVEFGKKFGAEMTTFYSRPIGLPLAAIHAFAASRSPKTYFISPGASNVLGALGHANALLETISQLKKVRSKIPDRIIVGAGTCGTIAGLMVGTFLSGEKVRITGVRCADAFVCNQRRTAKLANETLRFLGSSYRFTASQVDIVDGPGPRAYAKTSNELISTIERFDEEESIRLDTTYTAKVIMYLNKAIQTNKLENERLLYWHTFSPKAL